MGDNRSLPQPGALLVGKYRVERLLGQGGMGAVYAASHELLGQRVAVKVLLSDIAGSAEGQQRFLNEARAAARLDSEHVARVMDVGMLESGLPYMVLEYLEGCDLAQALETRRALPVAEAADYLIQTCEALAQAHHAGIVHRDLKPSNLYLARRQDGTSRVKVLDFGISKFSESAQSPQALTMTSSMLGTPCYMSPEQFVAPKSVDLRTDIWQMGIILYELVAGTPPFGGETFGQLMFAAMQGPVPSLSAARPDLPKGLAQVFERCVEREASRRFGSAVELAVALAPFGTGAQNALVERMQRAHGSSNASLSVVTGAGPRAGQTGSFGASGHTTSAWGAASQHDAARPRCRMGLVLGIAAAAVLLGAGALVAVTQLHTHAGPVASAGNATPTTGLAASTSPIPSATAAATLATPTASVGPDGPPAASAAPTTAPAASTTSARPPPTSPVVSPVAPTAAAHKPPAAFPRQARPTDQLPDNSRQ
ncbi:MAG TPA: serine/threonine-protein kinase [Polyangiaceae bacterium]